MLEYILQSSNYSYFAKVSDKKVIECTQDKKDKLTFKMLFDTGSCEFWIQGIGCLAHYQ